MTQIDAEKRVGSRVQGLGREEGITVEVGYGPVCIPTADRGNENYIQKRVNAS